MLEREERGLLDTLGLTVKEFDDDTEAVMQAELLAQMELVRLGHGEELGELSAEGDRETEAETQKVDRAEKQALKVLVKETPALRVALTLGRAEAEEEGEVVEQPVLLELAVRQIVALLVALMEMVEDGVAVLEGWVTVITPLAELQPVAVEEKVAREVAVELLHVVGRITVYEGVLDGKSVVRDVAEVVADEQGDGE